MRLLELFEQDHITPEYFTEEGCGGYALELTRVLPGSAIYVFANPDGQRWSDDIPYEVTHAVVGHRGKFYDVNGQTTQAQLRDRFHSPRGYLAGPFRPKEFATRFVGNTDQKPLYGLDPELRRWVRNHIKTHHLTEDHNHPDRRDVRWAVGKNRSKASNLAQRDLKDPDYVLVWANIKDIYDNAVPNMALDLDDPMGGKNRIGQRVPNAKRFWSGGGHMDPSLIYMRGSKVDFQDGRHRLVAAYQLGHRYAPVLVNREGLAAFQRVVRTKQDEMQVINYPVRMLGGQQHVVKVWKNPTLSQTQALVKRLEQVRALDDHHGNFYLWNATDTYHGLIRKELGLDMYGSTGLYLTPAGVRSDYLEWNGTPDDTINGINVWAEDDEDWRLNKGTIRAIGQKQITEAITLMVPMDQKMFPGTTVKVWRNPTISEVKTLAERYGELRGSASPQDFYVWDSNAAIHAMVAPELSRQYGFGDDVNFYIVPEGNRAQALEWHGEPERINGLYVWSNGERGYQFPSVIRGLGHVENPQPVKFWDDEEPLDESLRQITEAQSFEIVLGDWGAWKVRVWKNPTAQETRALVDRFKEARGMAEGNDFYLWNAMEAIHSTIGQKLGFHGVRFYLTPIGHEKYATEWEGEPETYNGMWVWASDDEGWSYPGAQRALGMLQPRLPQRQIAAESARTQVVQNPFDHTKEFRIWVNPVASQTRALVHQLGQVRGMCTGKNLYLWNANDATHADMEYALDKSGERLYMIPKGGQLEAPEWGERPPDQIVNGIEVWATWAETTLKLPGVARALGLRPMAEAIQRDRGSSDRLYAFNPTKQELAVFFKEDGGAAGVLDPKGNFGIGAGSLLAHHEVLQRLGMEESEMPNLQVMPKELIAECWISADDLPEDLTDQIENSRTVLRALEKTAYPKKRRQQIAMVLKKNPRITRAYGRVPPVVIHVLGDWTGEVVYREPY
jgi:hypothetical protein